FVTGWSGVLIAESMHRRPAGPARDGNIYLRIVKSDRHGDITFEEGPGYVGWWHCRGQDWKIDWSFAPESARRYRVEVNVLSPEPASGQHIQVAIGDRV